MEGFGGGKVVNVESKTVSELGGELTEAEKEVQRMIEKIVTYLLEKGFQSEDADDREVKMDVVERKAEEIIPKECWELVFRNLDAEDLLRCRKVCKTFNQLLDLKEFQVKWKFPPVLMLLFPYLESSDPDGDPWKHLYNARLVCRSWRHWIDKYASEGYGAGTKSFLPITTAMPLVTCFETLGDIEEFQEKFGECKASPFPSKSVYIGTPDREWVEDEDYFQDYFSLKRLEAAYRERVGQLLEQFGKHISRLELCFAEQFFGPDNLTWCKLLKGISTHLPNLRNFFIYGEPNEEDEEDDGKVASYIAKNALGALPKLQALSICGLDKIVDGYLLGAVGSQLTQFGTSFANLPTPLQMKEMKNVRKLWLPLCASKDTLESLLLLQSPLELLELTCLFKYGPPLETLNMEKVLCNLKHLPIEVLEIHLLIWGRMNLTEAGIDLKEYRNESIKTLIIHIDQYYPAQDHQISFNFLQALTKLKNLKFKFSREGIRATHPEELFEVVKLNEFLFGEEEMDRIYHSNVWEKVPSLKTITVTRKEDEDEFGNSIFTCEKYDRTTFAEGGGAERN